MPIHYFYCYWYYYHNKYYYLDSKYNLLFLNFCFILHMLIYCCIRSVPEKVEYHTCFILAIKTKYESSKYFSRLLILRNFYGKFQLFLFLYNILSFFFLMENLNYNGIVKKALCSYYCWLLTRWNHVTCQHFLSRENLYLNLDQYMLGCHLKVQLLEDILYIGAVKCRYLKIAAIAYLMILIVCLFVSWKLFVFRQDQLSSV